MRARIGGVEYDVVNHKSAQLLHLMELQQQSKAVVGVALGMRELARISAVLDAFQRDYRAWQAAAAAAQEDPHAPDPGPEPDTPDEGVIATAVTVFLTRRGAGEEIGLRDALRVSVAEIEELPDPVTDDVDQEDDDAPDPTPPGSGGPVTPDDDAAAAE